MHARRLIPTTVFALVLSACSITFGSDTTTGSGSNTGVSSTGSPTSTETPPTTEPVTSTTSTVAGIDVAVAGCGDAEAPFAALCRVVELIDDRFVDEVDADLLVTGALEGIERLVTRDATAAPPESFECAIPGDAYAAICDAVAADLAAGDGTIDDVVEQAIQGMVEFGLGDPFSSYLTPEALDLFSTNQTGAVEGIGALVQARETAADGTEVLCNLLSDACRIHIVAPLDGSPAEAAGIRAGDIIVAVDGEDVSGKTFDEVTAEVRGPAGTDVTLTLDRAAYVLTVTVTRASIDIPIVEARMLDDDIGYVRLTGFTNNSPEVFREALEELLDQGAASIIFDLQGNPGGSLNAAVLIASEFLDDGLVLRTESRDGGQDYRVSDGGVATRDLRVVVLVDEGSASASEVVTGALKESGRAVIMGEPTFGKNTVQRIWNLPGGGGLKLTIARWVTPGGIDYGLDGIAPDVPVEIPDDATVQFLIDAAVDYLDELDVSG